MKPHAIGKKMIMDHFFFFIPPSDINFSQIIFVKSNLLKKKALLESEFWSTVTKLLKKSSRILAFGS
jgi:hypothetical protein